MNKKKSEKEKDKKGKSTKILRIILYTALIISIISCAAINYYELKNPGTLFPKEIEYEKFLSMIDDNNVASIIWSEDSETITITDKKDNTYTTENPKYDDFKKEMLEKGISVKEKSGIGKYEPFITIFISLFFYACFFGVFMKMNGMLDGLGSKKEEKNESNIRFSDVAGLDEVKQDLMTVVDFLKNPEKYNQAGAEIPRGVLLYGAPGTGKTLLAKAVAGEAGVQFIAVSGSDFDEKYVGVGSNRMKKLFEKARQSAPCIVFIDEIDSLGGRRHSKQGTYDRQTLNTLLSEMDGFDGRAGVVVMAATNRLEDLDPALTRPGRFDNHFAVTLPTTTKERKLIVDLYTRNKKFADDIDLNNFAKETMGASPATIKTTLNDAAIIATRENNGIITRKILDEAWMKQIMEGHLKKNGEKDNIELIAWHEAGHALVSLIQGQDLTKVSIIPSTSGAGGATFITPKKLGLFTKRELEQEIIMLYAGRCAEYLLTGKEDLITTGASNDIEKATNIIKQMIENYGMSEQYGMLNLDIFEVNSKEILNEAVRLSEEMRIKTLNLLNNHKTVLKNIADELIKKETLTGEEVKEIAKR